MNITRWVLIGITMLVVIIFGVNIQIWAEEYKNIFMYNNDFVSYIMVFVFVIALTGIFRWLLVQEIRITKPKRSRKK